MIFLKLKFVFYFIVKKKHAKEPHIKLYYD